MYQHEGKKIAIISYSTTIIIHWMEFLEIPVITTTSALTAGKSDITLK